MSMHVFYVRVTETVYVVMVAVVGDDDDLLVCN